MSDLTWTNSTRKLSDLIPWENNPRQIGEADAARLAESLDQFGQIHAIAIGPGDEIYDGHQRGNVWAACDRYGPGYEVAVRVSSRALTQAEREKLVVYLHSGATGSWDWDSLSSWDAGTLKGWGLDEGQLRGWNDDAANLALMLEADSEPSDAEREEEARQTLAERFVVPPFSVLDARQGYWQERKRAWIALGIESELGRGGEAAAATKNQGALSALQAGRNRVSPGGSPRQAADYHGQRGDGRGRTLGAIASNQATGVSPDYGKAENGLLGESQQARSHYSAKDFGTEGNASEQTGTSIFDPVLCECAYTWWTGTGFRVLDPFAGGSVRGIVAAYLGREYVGVELRKEQVNANTPQAEALGLAPRWLHGDSASVRELVAEPVDFVFSCPPYYNLEVYSDLEGELSAAPTYAEFLEGYRHIIAECVALLKDDRFACFVVGDMRDKKGLYRNFVSDTIAAFQDAGATLYNEAILVTAVGSLPIRVSSQFPVGRKLGKTHQNVLVFVKGDWRKAAQACGPCEVVELTNGTPELMG